jgi:hypothetical protein
MDNSTKERKNKGKLLPRESPLLKWLTLFQLCTKALIKAQAVPNSPPPTPEKKAL